ncbi:MAG: hypothetical protein HND49_13480 [Planctomycetes bacterium]|nr:hypothetical protein [Planctomycetota bacterium]
MSVLSHADDLVKANEGTGGRGGVTFESIEDNGRRQSKISCKYSQPKNYHLREIVQCQ